MAGRKYKRPSTVAAHAGRSPHDQHGFVNTPVYHGSTVLRRNVAEWKRSREPGFEGYRYGRLGSPTRDGFEQAVAELYGAADAVATSSGLDAISTALMAVLKTGDHVLMADCVYEPARRFADRVLSRFGIETSYFDPAIGGGVAALMRPNTRVVYAESPGSHTFEVMDMPAVAEAAHAGGAAVIFDNTWGTALRFPALERGIDIAVEAVTKYIGGHSDLMMGVVVSNERYAADVRTSRNLFGGSAAPDDVNLAQRGLRTLPVRLAGNERNGLALAEWLSARPEVARVLHPALPDHPGHALWKRDFSGACGLFAILLHPVPETALAALLDGLELYGMGASWGGFESLMIPGNPRGARTAVPWTERGQLLRIHAGLEDIEDLIADLEAGFERLNAVARAAA